MKGWLAGALAALTLVLACGLPAKAQLAEPVVPGFRSLSGCPSTSLTPCFIPLAGASLTGSATATTAAFSASITPASKKTASLCGFVVTSGGTTAAAVVNVTVTGIAASTLNYAYVFPSSGQGVLGIAFPKCIEASAASSAITVSVPAGGAGTVAALSVWGFQQ